MIGDLLCKILNSKAAVRYVEFMTSVEEAISEKLDKYLPSYSRIEGSVPQSRNPQCRYSIDQCKCSEWGYKCDMLVGRKPPCQKCCPNDAIIWTGDYMEIDTHKCTGCGMCDSSCIHNAIERDGENIGLTLGKASRLLVRGTLRGIIGA